MSWTSDGENSLPASPWRWRSPPAVAPVSSINTNPGNNLGERYLDPTKAFMRHTKIFGPDAAQVVEARRFVSTVLDRWGVRGSDAPLLVSELATNAVLHARSEFSVTVSKDHKRVRVEVFDQNSRLPSPASVRPDAYSGRGLMLVQALAGAWGVDSHADEGKTIWFEVAL